MKGTGAIFFNIKSYFWIEVINLIGILSILVASEKMNYGIEEIIESIYPVYQMEATGL